MCTSPANQPHAFHKSDDTGQNTRRTREVYDNLGAESSERREWAAESRRPVDEVATHQLVQLEEDMIHDHVPHDKEPVHLGEQSHGACLAERVGTVVHEQKEEGQRTPPSRDGHVPADVQRVTIAHGRMRR
jgi:hypothetical protein